MIKIENSEVLGWEHAIRGMRNPLNSWGKSDSFYGRDPMKAIFYPFAPIKYMIGQNDLDLMLRLAKAGSVDGKFRRMIAVYVDVTAPLYWWKEFDTYKVGTVANSCSTMHKIHAKEFTLEDFSCEHLMSDGNAPYITFGDDDYGTTPEGLLDGIIEMLNVCRNKFLETKDKTYWWQMIQLLPTSYNQKRTVMLNYEVLANIYQHRRNHKLDEWRELCRWIESLPYSEIITCSAVKES